MNGIRSFSPHGFKMIFSCKGPKNVWLLGDSSEAVMMRIMEPSETPGITLYKAKSGSSTCQASATASPPQCLIFGLPSGARVRAEVVACLSSGVCSLPFEVYGYTFPKC